MKKDLLYVAGGAALVYLLWPKSGQASTPAPGSAKVNIPFPTGTTRPPSSSSSSSSTAPLITFPDTVDTSSPTTDAVDAASALYQQQAAMSPDDLAQSILTQGLDGLDAAFGATLIDLPSDMIARASEVDQQIRQVMSDVDANRANIPSSIGSAWDAFVTEWAHFTQQDQGAGQGWLYGTGIGNWWTAADISMDAINQRAQTLIDWRTKLAPYIAGGLSSPPPAAPPPPNDPLGLSKLSSMLPWIVGGIGLVMFGPALMRMIPKAKKETT